MEKLVYTSTLDNSVNFVTKINDKESIEARYVRRTDKYIVVYLSTQTGCKHACRMCHLTQTGQTQARNLYTWEILDQASQVLEYYWTLVNLDEQEPPAEIVHFNFMARGEPFSEDGAIIRDKMLLHELGHRAYKHKLVPRFNISTIMPYSTPRHLWKTFSSIQPDIYYSVYSTDPAFRMKWLPKAMPVKGALETLADWQQVSQKIPKLHFAVIKGENDDSFGVYDIIDHVNDRNLRVDVNIVRYNPFSDRFGEEGNYEYVERLFKEEWPTSKVQVIDRVGFDVQASCGMFYNGVS